MITQLGMFSHAVHGDVTSMIRAPSYFGRLGNLVPGVQLYVRSSEAFASSCQKRGYTHLHDFNCLVYSIPPDPLGAAFQADTYRIQSQRNEP